MTAKGAHMLVKLQSAIALFTCGCLVSVAASPSNVGFVVTNGQAHVDGSIVHGNSTLFQGSLVQAGNTTSDLMFPGGSNLLLQPEAAVKVYREYAVLQSGAVIQRGPRELIADGLRISSSSIQGAIVVGMKDKSHIEVAARGGPVEVRTAAGVLVAHLEAGKALSFAVQDAPQAPAVPQQTLPQTTPGQTAPTAGSQITVHGILRKDHAGRYGHYLLTDAVTKVTYELQGPDLEDLVGAQVEVIGSIFDRTPAEGASRVVSVSDIHQMPLAELPGATTARVPPATAPVAGVPVPSGDVTPPEVAANPEAPSAPDANSTPPTPPLKTHSDTTKILVIVALAAGAVVGVALGLGGGKSSTVSPA
jgi:hypothetical protein